VNLLTSCRLWCVGCLRAAGQIHDSEQTLTSLAARRSVPIGCCLQPGVQQRVASAAADQCAAACRVIQLCLVTRISCRVVCRVDGVVDVCVCVCLYVSARGLLLSGVVDRLVLMNIFDGNEK
jgi:hypothetical protein